MTEPGAGPDRGGPGLVIFDLDNTLVDRNAIFAAWLDRFVRERGLSDADRAWLVARDDDGMTKRVDYFADVRMRHGLVETVDELTAAFWRFQVAAFTCAPSAIEGIRSLRAAGHRVGIATNGGPVQADKIRAAGLDTEVDGWCVSGLVGSAKPERRIFELLAEQCGSSLEGAWVVGDRAEYDIAGAVAIGARSIWMRRGTAWPDVGFEPSFTIDTIAEAAPIILRNQAHSEPAGRVDATHARRSP